MAFNKLAWIGLGCCLLALVANMLPGLSFAAGIDLSRSWLLFCFGVFLIAASAAVTVGRRD